MYQPAPPLYSIYTVATHHLYIIPLPHIYYIFYQLHSYLLYILPYFIPVILFCLSNILYCAVSKVFVFFPCIYVVVSLKQVS